MNISLQPDWQAFVAREISDVLSLFPRNTDLGFKDMTTLKTYWFPILCTLITGVSLYDTLLIVKYSDTICEMEENPIGCWLLEIADGGISVFVRAKLAGTLTVLSVLLYLWKTRSRKAVPVTVSLAAYQTGLLAYLTFA